MESFGLSVPNDWSDFAVKAAPSTKPLHFTSLQDYPRKRTHEKKLHCLKINPNTLYETARKKTGPNPLNKTGSSHSKFKVLKSEMVF